jgi:hypothetical protein
VPWQLWQPRIVMRTNRLVRLFLLDFRGLHLPIL